MSKKSGGKKGRRPGKRRRETRLERLAERAEAWKVRTHLTPRAK